MSIDPRLMERRKDVAENNAKRNVTRLLKFLGLAMAVSFVVWLLFSPWLSVGRVDVTGVSVSDADTILMHEGIVVGTPMIRVRAGAAELALLGDQWIAEASVEMRWPNGVVVTVEERTAVAWVETSDGWARRAIDGVALPSEPTPDDEMARLEMTEVDDEKATSSVEVLGALEFIDALSPRRRSGAVVTTIDGELWATVTGFQVRLGRAIEMREKALSLDALLGEDIPEGSVLVLMAPTNPAVMTPQGEVETSDQTGGPPEEEEGDD